MEHRVHAKKRFGQNFLTDEAILEEIADSAQLTAEDVVLEIGPGTGELTARLAARAKHVVAVEIDESLREALGKTLSSALKERVETRAETNDAQVSSLRCGNVTVLFTDILKTDLAALRREYSDGRACKVVANLPYYISTPVIMKLLQDSVPPLSCTVMVQKELAERMCAAPGGKEYGELSVAVQYYAQPELVCEVPPHAFRPQPKVTSAVIRLIPLDAPCVTVKDPDFFFRVVEASFAHRRKTLVNSLSADPALGISRQRIEATLQEVPAEGGRGLPADIRAERLSIAQFACLADDLKTV